MRSHLISRDTPSILIYWILLLLPLFFKVELFDNIVFYPHEIILPVLIVTQLIFSDFKIKNFPYLNPYYFLLAGLALILLSTLISQWWFPSIEGLLKTLKYSIYIVSIILVAKVNKKGFVKKFNWIAFFTISITLIIFFVNSFYSGLSWGQYIQQATWSISKMPTGFSNLTYNFSSGEFVRYTGNHGIYGSYLTVVYLINLGVILDKKKPSSNFNYLLLVITVINIALLTSRETLLLFFVVNFFVFCRYLFLKKINPIYLVSFFILLPTIIAVVWIMEIDFVILKKINYTIDSIQTTGRESNVELRFAVWKLTLYSYFLYPFNIFIGYGNNEENYIQVLNNTNEVFKLNLDYANVPESFFNTFLAYGGIICLILGVIFFLLLLVNLSKRSMKKDLLAKLLFYFTFGLILTNNTGASIVADLLMTQYGLVFLWINQYNAKE